jgi:glycerate-2-kinase
MLDCDWSSDVCSSDLPLGDLVITGPTRTNVMDVRLALIA